MEAEPAPGPENSSGSRRESAAAEQPDLGERRRLGETVREWSAKVYLPLVERRYLEASEHPDEAECGLYSRGLFRAWMAVRLCTLVEAVPTVAALDVEQGLASLADVEIV